MNLFLLLTAMMSALTGFGRPDGARIQTVVEASQLVAAVQAVAPAVRQSVERPDGYVVPAPQWLNLRMMLGVARATTPERRRE